mgnify:CR=1 FL=1
MKTWERKEALIVGFHSFKKKDSILQVSRNVSRFPGNARARGSERNKGCTVAKGGRREFLERRIKRIRGPAKRDASRKPGGRLSGIVSPALELLEEQTIPGLRFQADLLVAVAARNYVRSRGSSGILRGGAF